MNQPVLRLLDKDTMDKQRALDAALGQIERVLGVDKGAGAAALLRLGDDMQRQRGLAGAFRPVNLDNAAARQPADAERDVEPERAGRDDLDLLIGSRAHAHDGALAEGALDLRHRGIQRLVLLHQGLLVLAVAAAVQSDDIVSVGVNILHTVLPRSSIRERLMAGRAESDKNIMRTDTLKPADGTTRADSGTMAEKSLRWTKWRTNTRRDVRLLGEQVNAMVRQIQRLQTDVRHLKGEP